MSIIFVAVLAAVNFTMYFSSKEPNAANLFAGIFCAIIALAISNRK